MLQVKGNIIEQFPDFLTDHEQKRLTGEKDKIKSIEQNERDHIITVIRECKGKIFGRGGAAEVLCVSVSALNARIKKLGINKKLL